MERTANNRVTIFLFSNLVLDFRSPQKLLNTKLIFMKKFILALGILFVITGTLQAQHISLNAYGGYTFQDKLSFSNSYALIHGGFMWGVSVEGVNAGGSGLELLYQYQTTDIPVYKYSSSGDIPLTNSSNTSTISYLLLNGIHYLQNNPKVEPYFGLGLGAAFVKTQESSSSSTKFAWDVKTGVKIMASKSVGFKLGAQLISSLQQTGVSYYYVYGVPYAYESYSNIWQFGFTGGLVFNFGH